MISGDIHPNPGPNIPNRHICSLCNACVRVNERVICCDVCDAWFHINCARRNCSVSSFKDSRVSWICERCDTPNFSQTIFSPTFTVHSNNYFSPISDHLGEPVACSRSVSIANLGLPSSSANTSSLGPLKVLTANANHFLAKHLELKQFIADNDVDILIACETKIDNTVQDAELGLCDFDFFRQDRNLNGGGMLVAVKKTLNSIRLDITTTCELVMVKLLTENTTPAIISALYRPPSSTLCIEELKRNLL